MIALLTASEKIQRRAERMVTRRVVRNLLMNTDMSTERIAEALEIPIKTVLTIRKSLPSSNSDSLKKNG